VNPGAVIDSGVHADQKQHDLHALRWVAQPQAAVVNVRGEAFAPEIALGVRFRIEATQKHPMADYQGEEFLACTVRHLVTEGDYCNDFEGSSSNHVPLLHPDRTGRDRLSSWVTLPAEVQQSSDPNCIGRVTVAPLSLMGYASERHFICES